MDNQKVDISVELSGSVEDVIYKNADNGYTVINLGCDEGLIAVVGNLGDVNEGERLSLRGGWITSPKYGRQFKAAMWSAQCRKRKAKYPPISAQAL